MLISAEYPLTQDIIHKVRYENNQVLGSLHETLRTKGMLGTVLEDLETSTQIWVCQFKEYNIYS